MSARRGLVDSSWAGLRLDLALSRLFPGHSRSRLQAWVRGGRVEVDGEVVDQVARKVWGGENVLLLAEAGEAESVDRPEPIPIAPVFEDDHIIVIDKPAGLVVHPGSGVHRGTLLNALLHHAPLLAGLPRAGIVHRLDRDTSGLLVVAKTLEAQTELVRQLQARSVKRLYCALVWGRIADGGVVDAPIGRHPTHRTKMAVVTRGRAARTHFRVVERFSRSTLVECTLETGRTHQIRVHMNSIGHPLVGDPTYGSRLCRMPGAVDFSRQALHAWKLGLKHPHSSAEMLWEAALPADFEALLAAIRSEEVHA